MKWILFLFLILTTQISLATDAGFCPRLEGKRSGVCRSERPGSGCIPDLPCAPAPILICEEESTMEQPIRNGGTCVSSEVQCTVTPEGRTCQQVCTKWDPATCVIQTARCCRKYKVVGEQKMKCCAGQCKPVDGAGNCTEAPGPDPGLKLPLCGANGRC